MICIFTGATLAGGGERSPLPCFKNRLNLPWFCLKSTLILEKTVLFVSIYGLNSHLKCRFKSIMEKKGQNFSFRVFLLYVVHETDTLTDKYVKFELTKHPVVILVIALISYFMFHKKCTSSFFIFTSKYIVK